MPRVTVGLAVYNGASTIRDTLESIQAQTYRDYEILVVDDGSTDDSGKIAESFGCKVVRQQNAGLGAGRKRLVEEANGDLIAFIDADDAWMPEKLVKQVEAIDETGTALVHTDCLFIFEDGRQMERKLNIPGSADSFDHILPTNLIVASSAIFDRRKMLEVGNFVPDTVRCSDWYGWFLLASRHAFIHLPETLVRYQVLSSSLANAGLNFHEAQRYLLEDKILPRVNELFARVPQAQRGNYRRMILRDLGVAHSSIAKHLHRLGKRTLAREHARKALRLAPDVLRVWSRAARTYLP